MAWTDLPLTRSIALSSIDQRTVDPAEVPASTLVQRTISVRCSSGSIIGSTWRGISFETLFSDEETIAPDTTHLLIESEDGYRVCVDIVTAFGGLVAFYRDGDPMVERFGHESRFVAPGIAGPRAIKDVQSIEPIELGPEEHPESYEELFLTEGLTS